MADDAEDKEGKEGEAPAKPKPDVRKLVLFIGLPIFVLIGAGAALYFSGILGPKTEATAEAGEEGADAAEHASAEQAKDDKEAAAKAVFFPLGDMMVNLNSDNARRPNYLKLRISLELANAKDLTTVESAAPRIIDNFQTYLRELRMEDLRGSAGLYRLREELLLRVSDAVHPVKIRDVLFQEMLVQ